MYTSDTPAHAIALEASETYNPLFLNQMTIPFDQIKAQHFMPAFEAMRERVEKKLQKLEQIECPTWDAMMLPLENIENEIHQVVNTMFHLKMVMDSPLIRLAWADVEPLYTKLDLRISQSIPLYHAFTTIQNGPEWKTLSSFKKRMVEKRLLSAKLNGIGLEGEKRECFNQLTLKLKELQIAYNANLLDATKEVSLIIHDKAQLCGVPDFLLEMGSNLYHSKRKETTNPQAGPWEIALNPTYTIPILRFAENRALREKIYRMDITKASFGSYDNSLNLLEQLRLRKEIANLLSCENYAEVSIAKKMAPDVFAVKNFLLNLRDAAYERGKQDLEEVSAFAKASEFLEQVMPWDYGYWAEKLKMHKFQLSSEELKQYFPFPKVLQGLFDLSESLFGISIQKAKTSVWHPDVQYFMIKDLSGKEIASFYLDPYSRPETKRGGAWMDSCRNRLNNEGRIQNPVAYVICNATPPAGSKSSYLNFREVHTLFHEFGHALQHLLTEVDFGSVSGTNGIEWDTVEMASQFMENWCYHRPTLKRITSHAETGESIPDTLIDRLIEARTFQSGMTTLRQLNFALGDLLLHSEYDPYSEDSPFDLWKAVALQSSPLPYLDEDRFLCNFHHIFGSNEYAAGYYSYKWAEVMSADAFEAFQEAGLENEAAIRDVGMRFRKTFLSKGGSVHPLEVFIDFRGRQPSIEALLRQQGLKTYHTKD